MSGTDIYPADVITPPPLPTYNIYTTGMRSPLLRFLKPLRFYVERGT
jgi:hypothetical protein